MGDRGFTSLKSSTRKLIDSADEVFVSSASIWELAIKVRLGKMDAKPEALTDAIESSGFVELPVRGVHAVGVATLELQHNDPFDRLLLAQALHEPLRLLTADVLLGRYSDLVIVV